MSTRTASTMSRIPHADLWLLGTASFFSRVQWIVPFYYHADSRANEAIFLSLAISLLVILAGYALACVINPRIFAFLARSAVLGAFLFLLWIQLRHDLITASDMSVAMRMLVVSVCLVLATLGASRLVPIWPRLRAALLAATVIGTASVFAMVAIFANRIEIFGEAGAHHRPVVVLLLDEMSGGTAHDMVAELKRRQLQVESWEVPSIGQNTLDVIPAIFSGSALPGARPCTSTAICGHSRVVDFARMSVARDDVDIVGAYHRYCVIHGLRHCVNPEVGSEVPLLIAFFCALPVRDLFSTYFDCPGYDALSHDYFVAAKRELYAAPFWSRGGLLYAHLLIPHPPGAGGELRLADAYAANLERAGRVVSGVADRFDQTPFSDDFSLVIVSDHHLRSEMWCTKQPYASHDCDLPAAMRSAGVPFIIATRGGAVAHRVPSSNVDLLPIVIELSRPR
ncbi:MAG TPA: hypothetical protein VGO61_02160 [Steroidobacteraceae bacterium]|jgi:hypothetical protein|nr:hypothetical protein [Steroidobacteraceae bacterium]